MNPIEALRRQRQRATPAVESRDVAALLQVSAGYATTILRRPAAEGMITHLTRGRWLINQNIDRQTLPELISAPYPAYISLSSALFHHGLIEQLPSVLYAVVTGRPGRLRTPMATISFGRRALIAERIKSIRSTSTESWAVGDAKETTRFRLVRR